jgi:hypothetical protein
LGEGGEGEEMRTWEEPSLDNFADAVGEEAEGTEGAETGEGAEGGEGTEEGDGDEDRVALPAGAGRGGVDGEAGERAFRDWSAGGDYGANWADFEYPVSLFLYLFLPTLLKPCARSLRSRYRVG